MRRRVIVLGSTGSIGTQTLDVIRANPDRFEVAYRIELEAFFRTLGEGGVPAPGPEEALRTLQVAVAARQSWQATSSSSS